MCQLFFIHLVWTTWLLRAVGSETLVDFYRVTPDNLPWGADQPNNNNNDSIGYGDTWNILDRYVREVASIHRRNEATIENVDQSENSSNDTVLLAPVNHVNNSKGNELSGRIEEEGPHSHLGNYGEHSKTNTISNQVKFQVYRELLKGTLQHHQEAHVTLLQVTGSRGGVREAVVMKWFADLIRPDTLKVIIGRIQNGTQLHHNINNYDNNNNNYNYDNNNNNIDEYINSNHNSDDKNNTEDNTSNNNYNKNTNKSNRSNNNSNDGDFPNEGSHTSLRPAKPSPPDPNLDINHDGSPNKNAQTFPSTNPPKLLKLFSRLNTPSQLDILPTTRRRENTAQNTPSQLDILPTTRRRENTAQNTPSQLDILQSKNTPSQFDILPTENTPNQLDILPTKNTLSQLDTFPTRRRRDEVNTAGNHYQTRTAFSPLVSFMNEVMNHVHINPPVSNRYRRSKSGTMYLPLGGTTQVQCPTAADAAGISITQLAFLSVCLTVFNIIVNINNNINNNNNNNNINSDNNLSNNNAQVSLNVNNGAQVNVMLPPRKKRTASLRETWQENKGTDTRDISIEAILRQVKQGNYETKEINSIPQKGMTPLKFMNTKNISLETILQKVKWETPKKGFIRQRKNNADGNIVKTLKKIAKRFGTMRTRVPEQQKENHAQNENINKSRATTAGEIVQNVYNKSNNQKTKLKTKHQKSKQKRKQHKTKYMTNHQDPDKIYPTSEGRTEAPTPSSAAKVSAGLMRLVQTWLQKFPLASPSCLARDLCGSLTDNNQHTNTMDTGIAILASLTVHRRVSPTDTASLHDFLASAAREPHGCRDIYPSCQYRDSH